MDLCDELLEEVLRRLPSSSSSADVSLVSKRWLRLYRSTRTTLSLRLSPDNCTPHSLSSFLSLFPNLSYLSVTINGRDRVSSFPDQILLSFASSRPKLTVASSCPKPARLCLQPEPVSHFPLLSLSTSFPHLTSLDIALHRPFNFYWLLFFHSLKNLNVSFQYVFEPVYPACEGNYDGELKLETLSFSGIQRGDHGLNWLWKSCKTLKKLQLTCCGGIGDDTSGSSFVNCLKDLQEVELIHCPRPIRDEILLKLVDNCASLSSLLVNDRYADTTGLRQFIARSRCNLRKLDLHIFPGCLRENDLLAVADKFTGLLSLRLCDFSFDTGGEGLKTKMLAMSNELEELALVYCNWEPGLLTTLGQKFRNLKKLDLSFNRWMAEEEFISMLVSCKFLTELKLRWCEGLTNASLVSMFKSCKQLESLDIRDCPGIGAESVELFVLNSSRLRQITVEESKISHVSRSWLQRSRSNGQLCFFGVPNPCKLCYPKPDTQTMYLS
ncbi:hypothetical protein RHSIM_Rhsim08G0050400 [Rhododendron simsii]|uniref:Uncharacterized protein n=1 Tax=Rhododendron simsii TaxID=118357 RepID=A0A834GMJ1_RHOSS|nr:hypothetical protein RHSIM_Rhsim08G0050400 [Rhododendron simsii]